MSYDATMLASNPIYQVRFYIGDTDPLMEFLSDDEIQFLLDINSGDVKKASLMAANRILAQWAKFTREREGQVEVYGNERFDNYKRYLEGLIDDPTFSSIFTPIPYAGGISKRDFDVNRKNSDVKGVNPGWCNDTDICACNEGDKF